MTLSLNLLAQEPVPRIFYGTRTHSQIKQVVKELARSGYRPRMTVRISTQPCQPRRRPSLESGARTVSCLSSKQRPYAHPLSHSGCVRKRLPCLPVLCLEGLKQTPLTLPRTLSAAPQVLGSRDQYCVNKAVRSKLRPARGGAGGGGGAGGASLNEECKSLLESKEGCVYQANFNRLLTHRDGPASGRPMDIEDLAALGAKINGCPYYASRALAAEVDLVFCPYNYLTDPIIRSAMEIDVSGAVVILDEGHNIEDTCREAASFTCVQKDLESAFTELESYIRRGGAGAPAAVTVQEGLGGVAQWVQTQEARMHPHARPRMLTRTAAPSRGTRAARNSPQPLLC